ncbi:MAG: DUF2804 domain-containing protein [Solobacterium sp.]|nr:DUF2804 domain-containing protein [Solobacterium sp.]
MQKELTTGGPLLDEHGKLNEAGWARRLVKEYSRSQVKANRLRIKEWDYYLLSNDRFAVALTIADNSYMGMISASFLDFESAQEITRSVMTVLPAGKFHMPVTSETGDSEYCDKTVEFRFINSGNRRHLICHYLKFDGDDALDVDVVIEETPRDSMVIATPFVGDEKAFYYNQKINCLPVKGTVILGNRRETFDPLDSFGVLDWGRGVWTYSNTWYWGSASGLSGAHRIGFNLGYGFGDTSAASENIIFFDGIGHKLDRVTFHIPGEAEGNIRYLEPWRITENHGRVNLVFEPILDRASDTNVGLIESDQHQVFGRFSGSVVLDDGRKAEIQDLIGFCEKVKNRW